MSKPTPMGTKPVANFPKFVDRVKKFDPEKISISGFRGFPGGATIAIGGYADHMHGLIYDLSKGRGNGKTRERSFYEHLFTVDGQASKGWNQRDAESIATSTGLIVLAAELRLATMQSYFSDLDVHIKLASGEPATAEQLAASHANAIGSGATQEVAKLFLIE